MLNSVRSLQEMNYRLFGSLGTADYYEEHGIKVSYPLPNSLSCCKLSFTRFLVVLCVLFMAVAGLFGFCASQVKAVEWPFGETETEAEPGSIADYLARNEFDLVINLPMRHRVRKPASYVTQGYRTRRMAVDYAVPLITDVKAAKMFIEVCTSVCVCLLDPVHKIEGEGKLCVNSVVVD